MFRPSRGRCQRASWCAGDGQISMVKTPWGNFYILSVHIVVDSFIHAPQHHIPSILVACKLIGSKSAQLFLILKRMQTDASKRAAKHATQNLGCHRHRPSTDITWAQQRHDPLENVDPAPIN